MIAMVWNNLKSTKIVKFNNLNSDDLMIRIAHLIQY